MSITQSDIERYTALHTRIIEAAQEAAPEFDKLTEGDPKYASNDLEATEDRWYPTISIDDDEITFYADITHCGNTERESFSMPLVFLSDREGWTRAYQKLRIEYERAEQERADAKAAEKAAQDEAFERAQYERLQAKYGSKAS